MVKKEVAALMSTKTDRPTDHVLWGCAVWNNKFLTTNMEMFGPTKLREELEAELEASEEESHGQVEETAEVAEPA